jgi:hypothetical protein
MSRCIIDGFPHIVDVATVENYTDDILGSVPGITFIKIVGNYTCATKTVFNGSDFKEVIETKPFEKIVNSICIREWIA